MREYIKLGGTLCAIAAIVTLLLAVTEHASSDKIAAIEYEAEVRARHDVIISADGVDESTAIALPVVEDDSIVSSITRFESNKGYVYAVDVEPLGYGGAIEMMVGVNSDLEVIGISIIDSSKETPGLGTRATDPEYTDKFIGKTKGVSVVKHDAGENKVLALTGATLSSKAVGKGIKKAIEAAEEAMNN